MISNEILSSLANIDYGTDDLFTCTIPVHGGFTLTPQEWEKIADSSNQDWGDILANKISILNSVCCFQFKKRWIKRSFRKRSSYLFKTEGSCSFASCSVTLTITVSTECRSSTSKNASVTFDGQPKHNIHERHARKVKGSNRKELKEHFSLLGTPPGKVYHDKLRQLSGEEFLAGKRDKIGRSKHVLQKISAESRHMQERDKDYITSLRMLAEEEEESSRYIQCVQAIPFAAICFNATGVRIYHELAGSCTIFCDATGTIVSIASGKRILYYAVV